MVRRNADPTMRPMEMCLSKTVMKRLTRTVLLLCVMIAPTHVMAIDFRWTQGFAQGTVIAGIRNTNDSSLSIYCPSGQSDTTPGISIESKAIRPRPGEQILVQIVVDGVNHAFVVSDPSNSGDTHFDFRAHGRAARQDLENLVRALSRGRQRSFVVEFPKQRHLERFSLLGARRALLEGRGTILDGC